MIAPKKLLKGLLAALVMVPLSLMATPASAAPPADDPEQPWRLDQWPQTQPWQLDAPAEGSPEARLRTQPDGPAPIDPQNWKNPDHMTWSDYTKPPGTKWADPKAKGPSAPSGARSSCSTTPTSLSWSPSPGLDRLQEPQRRGPRHPP